MGGRPATRNRETPSVSRTSKKSSKSRGRRKLLSFLVLLLVGGLFGGFITFASHVDHLERPLAPEVADGIVVWTGPGGGRLAAAGALLDEGLGERLLVSGVNPSLSEERVSELTFLSADKALCCLDVDYAALDTRGNARETASWAEALGYDHVILVTSSYHMPRALVELGHEMPGLRITALPVPADTQERWWQDVDRFQRVAGEYGKYLMVLARGRSRTDAERAPVLPEDGLEQPDLDTQNG